VKPLQFGRSNNKAGIRSKLGYEYSVAKIFEHSNKMRTLCSDYKTALRRAEHRTNCFRRFKDTAVNRSGISVISIFRVPDLEPDLRVTPAKDLPVAPVRGPEVYTGSMCLHESCSPSTPVDII